ncbi:hypothetical protein FRC03_004886 [Tulasnella sp. 419]|nr:hypothetical protein FRC03_004886 [Tulasnella sp. 419]
MGIGVREKQSFIFIPSDLDTSQCCFIRGPIDTTLTSLGSITFWMTSIKDVSRTLLSPFRYLYPSYLITLLHTGLHFHSHNPIIHPIIQLSNHPHPSHALYLSHLTFTSPCQSSLHQHHILRLLCFFIVVAFAE